MFIESRWCCKTCGEMNLSNFTCIGVVASKIVECGICEAINKVKFESKINIVNVVRASVDNNSLELTCQSTEEDVLKIELDDNAESKCLYVTCNTDAGVNLNKASALKLVAHIERLITDDILV